jgi:site-specific DNA-methyltransferase (adenine-specific)
MKAPRNKTIDISIEAGQHYLARCLKPIALSGAEKLLDKTICGDSMECLALLPRAFADLVIVDPPYNLAKDFGGAKFKKLSDEEYEQYTESWLMKLLPLMKENASLYVCCDWQSGAAIMRVLKRYFIIQNRITWQREKTIHYTMI